MKRVWFAVAFLALCIGLCVFEQNYVGKCCEDMISIINQAIVYENADESDKCDAKIDELQKYWIEKNDVLFIFSEHDGLDELAESIRTLNMTDDKNSALAKTKALVKIYYENERMALSNVL